MFVYTDHNFKFNLGGRNCGRCNVPWAFVAADDSPRYGLKIGTSTTAAPGSHRCLCGLGVTRIPLPSRWVSA